MLRVIGWVALVCCATSLYAQSQTSRPRFALEIQDPAGLAPHFVLVEETQGVQQTLLSFRQLSPHRPDSSETASAGNGPPSAVKLEYKYEPDRDAIAINASAVFGAFATGDAQRTLEGHLQQSIGNYSVRPNDPVVLEEMERFGLQPWTIKVVAAQIPNPSALSIANKVPSIQLEVAGEDREGARVIFHNLSSQAVAAFAVSRTNPGGGGNTSIETSSPGAALIESGASREVRFDCEASGSETSNGFVPDPASCPFVLEAALFADGSHEGDAIAAASLEAARSNIGSPARTPKCTIDIADGKSSGCTLVKADHEWILWSNSASKLRSVHFKEGENPFTESSCWDVEPGARARSGPVALNAAAKTYVAYSSDAPCASNPPSNANRGTLSVVIQ